MKTITARRFAAPAFFSLLQLDNRRRAAACVLTRTAQRPVLLVTHDREDLAALDARIIRLRRGDEQ